MRVNAGFFIVVRGLFLVCMLCSLLACRQKSAFWNASVDIPHVVGNAGDTVFHETAPSDANALNVKFAPCWESLSVRLAQDGLRGAEVDALLASLGNTPTQSPMGRKIRELYNSQILQKKKKFKPARHYKGVVTQQNANICREYVATHKASFIQAQQKYGVPPAVAVSLLFVETRLGKVLGDVPENAFYTLASMAVSRTPQSISSWLGKLPGYEQHMDWLASTMNKRADWAYVEVRALVKYMLRDKIAPQNVPGSIYGAVGLCQFMPSNIPVYGEDGDRDGKVDLFTIPDAVASLAKYLSKHGWRQGLSYKQQHKVLMTYNHSSTYANTILDLSQLIAPPKKQKPQGNMVNMHGKS